MATLGQALVQNAGGQMDLDPVGPPHQHPPAHDVQGKPAEHGDQHCDGQHDQRFDAAAGRHPVQNLQKIKRRGELEQVEDRRENRHGDQTWRRDNPHCRYDCSASRFAASAHVLSYCCLMCRPRDARDRQQNGIRPSGVPEAICSDRPRAARHPRWPSPRQVNCAEWAKG